MATAVKMPKLGMTMTEGRLTRWKKSEGDYVKKGEVLYCVTTDKVNIDIEATEEGVLIKIVCNEGDTVRVGDTVAWIGQESEAAIEAGNIPGSEDGTEDAKSSKSIAENDTDREAVSVPPAKDKPAGVRATPAARAYAKQNGVDIRTVSGSGFSGRIRKKDVEEAATWTKISEGMDQAWEDIELLPVQEITARKMTESFTTVPHFYLTIQADASAMIRILEHARASIKGISSCRATFTDVLIWILSRVIPGHPRVNSAWMGDKIRIYKRVNIGIAVDTDSGLVVPVIHDSDKKSFSEIAAERERLVGAARKGKLLPDDIAGGTFTMSNLGMFGVNTFQAIVNSPQSALLAVGGISKVLVKEDDNIVEKPLLMMSLSCDHRVLDGAAGARFLKLLKEVMEKPAKLLDADLF